ncbi:MAG TPA: LysR substrate-binding domain-containing protein, partial [Burkholderiales bacterium]|nr:LysR substrate-binding domain-containing protein [Burkholderiales bacterium]
MRPAMERLRIRHLRLLELLIELGTVRKAAEALSVSQPAVSEMLKELESAFGGPLFQRTRGGVVPNRRAAVLLRRLRTMLGELRAADAELSSGARPALRVGANLQFLMHLLPQALKRFRAAHHDVAYIVREGSTALLVDELLRGNLDCIIGRLTTGMPGAGQLAMWPLYGGELCFVVGRTHPLAKRKRVSLEDLANEEWALGGINGAARKIVEETFAGAGLRLHAPVLECRPQFANLAFAASMQLVTVATRSDAVAAERAGTVAILPVELPVKYPPVAFMCRDDARDDRWLGDLR